MSTKTLKFKLASGNDMPMIGFGTFRIHGSQLIKEVLDLALRAGYRSIDTAAVYRNEKDIGDALKLLLQKYNLKRKDIFITTKLAPSDHAEKALPALLKSIKNLDCQYLDLYLIHWPGQSSTSVTDASNLHVRTKTWQSLVEAKKQGLVRDIGVSNYTVKHLEELLSNNSGENPAVNQVEWHPHYYQSYLKDYCNKHNILLQAYSSLGGTNNPDLISDASIVIISKKLEKTPSQVLLKWALQQNVAIIPKATSEKHIRANIDLDFEIPVEDIQLLNNLKKTHKYAWNPEEVL